MHLFFFHLHQTDESEKELNHDINLGLLLRFSLSLFTPECKLLVGKQSPPSITARDLFPL